MGCRPMELSLGNWRYTIVSSKPRLSVIGRCSLPLSDIPCCAVTSLSMHAKKCRKHSILSHCAAGSSERQPKTKAVLEGFYSLVGGSDPFVENQYIRNVFF